MNKENAIKILKNENLSQGELSEIYWLLNKDLYKEKPVTIQEFIMSDDFVHKKWPNIFPLWKQTLGELFPTPFIAPYNEVLISAAAGAGKALSHGMRVLQPSGWVKIEDVEVGDSVCGVDGKPYIILGVYPQGTLPTYDVCFDDGTKVRCSGDHLWTVQSALDRDKATPSRGGRYQESVLTTDQMRASIRCEHGKRLNYSVNYIQPCYFHPQEVKIDPYLLGLLIGDGSISQKQIVISNTETDIIQRMYQIAEKNGWEIHHKDGAIEYRFTKCTSLNNALKEYHLKGKRSWEKHIPKEYLYNSVDVRLALLHGLIDTDGCVDSKERNGHKASGKIEYSTTSPQLRDDIIELVRSLGGRTTYTERMGKYTTEDGVKETRLNYRIYISFYNGIVPFSSEKHLSKYKPENKRPMKKYITDIIPAGEEECTCIKVSAPDSLFITEGYNPTHNTVTSTVSIMYDIYKLGCLKNPCTYYGLTPDTQIIMAIFSATGSTAAVNWAEITTAIQACPWMMDKLVDKRGLEKKNGSITPVEIIPGVYIQTGSKFQHSMGKAIFDGLMDEAAFGGANMKDAQKSYNELSSRIKTRFSNWGTKGNTPGHLFLISSPKEAGDFMQYRIEKAQEAGSSMTKVLQNIATWEADPRKDSDDKFTVFIGNENKEPCMYEPDADVPFEEMDYLIYPPMRYYDDFKKDLLISIMNYGGVTTTNDMALFKGVTALNDVIITENPFKSDVIELPFSKTDKTLMDYADIDYFKSIKHPEYNRFIHLDAAFSTNTLDVYGLAATYSIYVEDVSYTGENGEAETSDIYSRKDRLFFTDFVVGITAPKGEEVPLFKVQDFIEWLSKMGYPIASVSADQFQSKQTLQNLQVKGFNTENISVDKTRDPYLFLRQLVYNKQIFIPRNEYLKTELKKLRDDGKKVDHPATHHKDLADAVAGSVWACANSNKVLNSGRVAKQVLGTMSYNPTQAASVEIMEFERIRQNMNQLLKGF